MNFTKLCFVCTEIDVEMHPVATSIAPRQQTFSSVMDLWNIFTKLLMRGSDDMPDYICINCLNNIHTSYEFLAKCEASQNRLMEINNCITPIKEEPFESNEVLHIKGEFIDFEIVSDENDTLPVKSEIMEVISDGIDESKLDDKAIEANQNFHSDSSCPSSVKNSNETDITKNLGDLLRLAYQKKNNRNVGFAHNEHSYNICNKKSSKKGSIPNHMCGHNPDGRLFRLFECKVCKIRFASKMTLQEHEKKHEAFRCTKCSIEFTTEELLIAHVGNSHSPKSKKRSYMCRICLKLFSDMDELVCHVKRMHENPRYKRNICKKLFMFNSSLDEHLIKVHNNVVSNICYICCKEFAQSSAYMAHIRTHSRREKDIRKESEQLPDQIDNTQRIVAAYTDMKLFNCTECSRQFIYESGLKLHMRFHQNDLLNSDCK